VRRDANHPAATYALVGINLDTGLPEPAPDSFWRGVVAQLRLTPKQASGDAFGEGAARGHVVLVKPDRRPLVVWRAGARARLQACDAWGQRGWRLVLWPFVLRRIVISSPLSRFHLSLFNHTARWTTFWRSTSSTPPSPAGEPPAAPAGRVPSLGWPPLIDHLDRLLTL
jgi:hypothetical protein